MGAWSHSSFGNDDAMDFVGTFLENPVWSPVHAALAAANAEGYLEAPEASCAIAAAEIIAAKRGKPGPDFPDDVAASLAALSAPSPEYVALARKAVTRIMDNSELAQLWSEDGPTDIDWLDAMEDLLKRLA